MANHAAIVRQMENYSTSLNDVFHALANPIRRSVIAHLCSGAATITELAAPYQLGLPTFLKHITVLESSGLISTTKTGRVRVCELKRNNLIATEKWFDQRRAGWQSRHDKLDILLNDLKGDKDESSTFI